MKMTQAYFLLALGVAALGVTDCSHPAGTRAVGSDTARIAAEAQRRRELEPVLLELQEQVRLNFADEFPHALRDDLKEELALSLEALVLEAYAGE